MVHSAWLEPRGSFMTMCVPVTLPKAEPTWLSCSRPRGDVTRSQGSGHTMMTAVMTVHLFSA